MRKMCGRLPFFVVLGLNADIDSSAVLTLLGAQSSGEIVLRVEDVAVDEVAEGPAVIETEFVDSPKLLDCFLFFALYFS